MENLDARVAMFSAPGSENFTRRKAFFEELVATGERVIPGEPDDSTIDVERVDPQGAAPYQRATVTFCAINNRVRVDAAGTSLSDGLVASRLSEDVVPTANGWLPDGTGVALWDGLEVTTCAPE